MKKAIKWLLIVVGALVALVIVALLVIPMFVDVQEYKPEIEKKVSEATGRPFTINGDLKLSLFPWVGLAFSDLHLGNAPGFQEKDLLFVKSFEVRVKLIPLISKHIQVERFILEGPRVVLEKNKKGLANWEGIGKQSDEAGAKPSKEKAEMRETQPGEALSIEGLAVGEFAVKKGSILWIDGVKGERKEISDVTLQMKDVSLDQPVQFTFSAKLDGHPLELKGKVGPVGKEPGKGATALDLTVTTLKNLVVGIKGNIVDLSTRQEFDLAIKVSPCSPRKIVSALGKDFPVKTADPKALNRVALQARVKGNPKRVSVLDGVFELDDSKVNFSVSAKDFSKPAVAFDFQLDQIDLDRYLPPPSEKKPAEKRKEPSPPAAEKRKTDYTPLRKLVLDGKIRVGALKAHGARIQDLYLKISGKKGLFRLDPLSLKLYQGDVSSKGTFDVRGDTPKSNMALQAKGIQVNPLLKDVLGKDFLEGTTQATLNIALAGDEGKRIKRTLTGKGDFLFNDGAIKGIDLAGMVRNAAAAFGLAEKGKEKPRTDFSALHAPFTITKGLVDTQKTTLVSPIIRVLVKGKADLVKETMNFRVEPKFVGTLKGQGDTGQRTGITVPVLVTGSFSSPKFRPDLEGLLKKKLEMGIPESSELNKMLKGEGSKEGEAKPLEEKGKGLLKGLLGR